MEMSYLCSAFGDALRVKAAAQHSSSELGSAFALALHLHRQKVEKLSEPLRVSTSIVPSNYRVTTK